MAPAGLACWVVQGAWHVTRVLFVCPNLQAGGAERHWSILLPLLVSHGFDVRLLTLDGRGPFYDALQAAGIPVTCARSATGRLTTYGRATWRLARDPADVIVSRGTSAEGIAAVAQTVRACAWVVNWHHPSGLVLAARRRAILRGVMPRADAVVAVSASQLSELAALGVRRASISVIPNGSDFRPASEQRDTVRAALGVQSAEVAVLLVGRLEPQKRVDLFVDAIATVQRRRHAVVGLIAGSGPDADKLMTRAIEAGARVRFLGRRDDMPGVMAAADVLCLTSETEAAPFAVLEAMASGLPVVATNVGSLPELVVDGETGLLVEPGAVGPVATALIELTADPARLRQMGLAGRARQHDLFSAEVMADKYAAVITAAVKR